jgi:hypothetical protein
MKNVLSEYVNMKHLNLLYDSGHVVLQSVCGYTFLYVRFTTALQI